MRQYIRHPSDIPISYRVLSGEHNKPNSAIIQQPLQNVSSGGLCFVAGQYLPAGSRLQISIATQRPPFEATATVVWSHQRDDGYHTGLAFEDADVEFALRMVEQLCHIEKYRRDIWQAEGRELTSEQAAAEWIAQYADNFPN